MGKKIVIVFIVVMIFITIIFALISTGIIKFETVEGEIEEAPKVVMTVDDLQDGKYYVWHDKRYSLEQDLEGAVDPNVFMICPEGTINWKKNKSARHAIWFSSEDDFEIPTLFPGDELIYVSSAGTPGESNSAIEDGKIKWERFADYGYTIGVVNLNEAKNGHYFLDYHNDYGFEGVMNMNTDAKDVASFKNYAGSRIFLDKVGNKDIREGMVSPGGTILGLKKDYEYVCNWYKGSFVSHFKMAASSHAFCLLESFDTYEWNFVANNNNLSNIRSCVTISIPEHFKTGYYYINGGGLFRYVGKDDISEYNGQPYDASVDWNDPIILYDDKGMCIYNPFNGIDERSRIGVGTSTKGGSSVVNENYEEQQKRLKEKYPTNSENIYRGKDSDFPVVEDPNINLSDPGIDDDLEDDNADTNEFEEDMVLITTRDADGNIISEEYVPASEYNQYLEENGGE